MFTLSLLGVMGDHSAGRIRGLGRGWKWWVILVTDIITEFTGDCGFGTCGVWIGWKGCVLYDTNNSVLSALLGGGTSPREVGYLGVEGCVCKPSPWLGETG